MNYKDAINIIQKYIKIYIIKKNELKKIFINYNLECLLNISKIDNNSIIIYDPFDDKLKVLINMCNKYLLKVDLKEIFWKEILKNILFSLHLNEYNGGPYSYIYNEIYDKFKNLLRKLMTNVNISDYYLDNIDNIVDKL